MSKTKTKAVAREERRARRVRNDDKLFRLAAEKQDFEEPVKPSAAEIRPLNDAQRRYDAAMCSSDVVFGVGPAGTGKTWLATMRACQALQSRQINKIVLTRPAVEAGESLGFLPGELEEKYEPYLRPVRDALEEFFGSSHLDYLLKRGSIEARPLGFLRGASLANCWLIADEMQNATIEQFKMLLTRIGEGAKFIINGDPGQTDLRGKSGLIDALRRSAGIEEVSTVLFARADIVRSGLCGKFVEAYETPSADRYNADNENEGLFRYLHEPIG